MLVVDGLCCDLQHLEHAADTAAAARLAASEARQMGFTALAAHLTDTANAAERWMTRCAAKLEPRK